MAISDAIIEELVREAELTRKVLERIPQDKLAWKPHPRSMSIGQLALHVTFLPGFFSGVLLTDGFDISGAPPENPQPKSLSEILQSLDSNIAQARESLGKLDDRKMQGTWKLTRGEKVLMALPRLQVTRTILLNHIYHHRGQLQVYLRLLEVKVPAIYGPTADENPFAAV